MITRLVVLVAVLSAGGNLVNAETGCDCDHFPWEPDSCVDLCGALVLSQANLDELKTFLKLDVTLAKQIVALKQGKATGKFQSLGELKRVFPEQEFKKILQSLDNLKPLEAEYLVQASEKRQNFRDKVMIAPPPH
jgi:hypothetical protein